MSCGPEIGADAVAKKKLEDDRAEFLRRCAVAFAGSGVMPGDLRDLSTNLTLKPAEFAAYLVRDWSALYDAIEATRSK